LDKLPLVQCSQCHKLGHTAASQTCPVPKGDIRCAKCTGAHATEAHAQHCRGRHAVAGTCDCKLPCLNCANRDHDCRDHRCPARDNYRARRCKQNPNKGKGKDNTGPELTEAPEPQEERAPTPATLQPNTSDAGPQPGPSNQRWTHRTHVVGQQEDQSNLAL